VSGEFEAPPGYPFAAVVGMEEVKLALLIGAVERRLGGVLLRGQKGSAKSTLARGLADLLPGDPPPPFVELPIGATEDRVVGTLDLAAALRDAERRFHPGLLSAADGGVLYVDEVNLLPDHLVDVLLDVAASGINRVERDGVSVKHASSFILIGSMNPEEGELRPQLLDRFGLSVDVAASAEPSLRAEAVSRRLAFDLDPAGAVAAAAAETAALRAELASYAAASLPAELIEVAAALAVALGADGLRADLALCRAAAALAGLEHRRTAIVEDVRRVAPLALGHRRRRGPFDEPGISAEEIDRALDEILSPERRRQTGVAVSPSDTEPGGPGSANRDRGDSAAAHESDGGHGAGEMRADRASGDGDGESPGGAARPASNGAAGGDGGRDRKATSEPDGALADVLALSLPHVTGSERVVAGTTTGSGRGRHPSSHTEGTGRVLGSRPADLTGTQRVAVAATALAAAQRRGVAAEDDTLVHPSDLHTLVTEQRVAHLVVMCVDTSGSMGARHRVAAARGAVLSLLTDAYRRRDRVAVVTFAGEGARLVLRPTGSVEVARARLGEVGTGGRTPLADGILAALELCRSPATAGLAPVLVLVTDGRATSVSDGSDPVVAARAAAAKVRQSGITSLVVDVESGHLSLGFGHALAVEMGARHVHLGELTAEGIDRAVREVLAAP
jgi:magnesium chelatase subunit D